MKRIATDLTENDYLRLIEEARGDVLNHTSHKPIKMFINNYEIIADMQCLGVKMSDGGRTIEGKFIPPIIKFGFRISFECDNIDLVKEVLESQNVYVDNKKYYVGDYRLKEKMFCMKFVSYDLYKRYVRNMIPKEEWQIIYDEFKEYLD